MNLLGIISQKYSLVINDIHNTLDKENPIPRKNVFTIFSTPTAPCREKMLIDTITNIGTLSSEILFRPILILDRSFRIVFTATVLVLSTTAPVFNLFLPNRYALSYPSAAWKNFCTNVRHLSAELYEIIAVVVCRCLLFVPNALGILFPNLGDKISKKLLTVQDAAEKISEIISGERLKVNNIKEKISFITEKKDLFSEIRCHLDIEDKAEKEIWLDNIVDLDIILSDLNDLKTRRISRTYSSLCKTFPINEKFAAMENIISEKMTTIVIPKLIKKLTILKTILGVEISEDLTNLKYDDTFENKLRIYQKLQHEIKITINKLHQIHDPKEILQKDIQKLKNNILESRRKAIDDVMHQKERKSLASIFKQVRVHFFISSIGLIKIEELYSYEDVVEQLESNSITLEEAQEIISSNFKKTIKDKLNECLESLNYANLSWDSENINDTIDRKKALLILGITDDNPSDKLIKSTYHRLALKHHPDKKGKREIFEIIHRAYEVLIPQ